MRGSLEMMATYRTLRRRAFAWRGELPVAGRLTLTLGMAALTGLCAQVRIPLPFTPVPLTGQVFAVLLAGVALGGFYGGLSQVFYVGLGAAGLPWFTGWSGGLGVLRGATGGYLVGFAVAAALLGWVTHRHPRARRFAPLVGLMWVAVLVIYFFGALNLHLVLGTDLDLTFLMGVLPFLGADAAKAVIAAGIGTALLPKDPGEGR